MLHAALLNRFVFYSCLEFGGFYADFYHVILLSFRECPSYA